MGKNIYVKRGPTYVENGIAHLLNQIALPLGFNPSEYLLEEYNRRLDLKKPMTLPEILVAGGGYWPLITDLSRGFVFEYNATVAEQKWQEPLHNERFKGLEGKVLGDYAAMNRTEKNSLRWKIVKGIPLGIHQVLMWPIISRRFNEKYFMIIDVGGPAEKNIEDALPVYSRVIEPKGFALVRVPTKTYEAERSVKSMAENKHGFVVAQQGNRGSHTYFLLARRPTSS